MDHDSVAGAWEFLQACEILGTHATVGFEMRVHIGKNYGRINNPDQDNHMYMAIHGIPHQNLDAFDDYLSVLRQRRNVRNRQMVEKINQRFAPHGIGLDFDRDVFPISKAAEGGTITERHLLYAPRRFTTSSGLAKRSSGLSRKLRIKISDDKGPPRRQAL